MDITYKIIGGDGTEYGPVSLAELKAWIADGRVAGPTRVWRSDAGRWSEAAGYAELHPEIGQIEALAARLASDARESAGFWMRFGAYLVDGMLMYGPFLLVDFLLAGPLGWKAPDLQSLKQWSDLEPFMATMWQQFFVQRLLRLIYEVPMTALYGATLGKMLVGLQVIRTDASPVGWRVSLLRFLGKLVGELPFFLGCLWAAFRRDKRAWHDLMTGTRVVRRGNREP